MVISTKQGWRQFWILFTAQLVSYGLLCWNYRAVAKGFIPQTVCSDLMIAALSFKVLKQIMKDSPENSSTLAWVGYTLGGAIGSAISIYMTKLVWGN